MSATIRSGRVNTAVRGGFSTSHWRRPFDVPYQEYRWQRPTGAGDRETLPRSRHKLEARLERHLLSSPSLPQVRTPLDCESRAGGEPAFPVTTAGRLHRLRETRGGSGARDLFTDRDIDQSVAVPCLQELLADIRRASEQHRQPIEPVGPPSEQRRPLPHA